MGDETYDGRQLLQKLKSPSDPVLATATSDPATGEGLHLPALTELQTKITSVKLIEIIGPAPELRLTENDQADPAGRYRIIGSGDELEIQRALTAGWATATDFITIDSVKVTIPVKLTIPVGTDRFR